MMTQMKKLNQAWSGPGLQKTVGVTDFTAEGIIFSTLKDTLEKYDISLSKLMSLILAHVM